MFNIGFGELVIIGVVALIVIGPKQLPEVARVLGRLIGEFKKATEDLSGGLLDASKDVRDAWKTAQNEVQQSADQAQAMPPPPESIEEHTEDEDNGTKNSAG